MSFAVTQRIDLDKIVGHSDWSDCYILVDKATFPDIKQFTRKDSEVERQTKRAEREIKKLNALLEKGIEDEDSVYEQIEEQEKKIQKLGEDRLDIITNFIASKFQSGKGFDRDAKAIKDITTKDIPNLPIDMLNGIVERMSGKTEKKS